MRTNCDRVNRVLITATILACILLPISAIADEPSVNHELLQAAEKWSFEQIKTLVEKGGDVNAKDELDSSTVLMKAAASGNLEATKFLINKGADVKAVDMNRETVLMKGAESGNLEVVKLLVNRGIDVKAKDVGGFTALIYAAKSGTLEVVKLFVGKGLDVNVTTKGGSTALMYAAESGNLEAVKFFVGKGLDVRAKTRRGDTVLMFAAKSRIPETVRFLVDKGLDVNAKTRNGRTALMYAAESGNVEVAKLLMDKGADAHAKMNFGDTVLMYAAESGNLDLVKAILDKEVDVNAKDTTGNTALRYAVGTKLGDLNDDMHVYYESTGQSVDPEIVKLLIEKGADVNAENDLGQTVLMGAAKGRHPEVLRILIDRGAEVNLKDKEGHTALMHAARVGTLSGVKLLVERGADVSGKYGQTALNLASARNQPEIVEYLKAHGVESPAPVKKPISVNTSSSEARHFDKKDEPPPLPPIEEIKPPLAEDHTESFLHSKSATERKEALHQINLQGHPEQAKYNEMGLKDPSPDVREIAASFLVGEPEHFVPMLINVMADDPDARVRASAGDTLDHFYTDNGADGDLYIKPLEDNLEKLLSGLKNAETIRSVVNILGNRYAGVSIAPCDMSVKSREKVLSALKKQLETIQHSF
jgi:ankyrin repeat protein